LVEQGRVRLGGRADAPRGRVGEGSDPYKEVIDLLEVE
jgi:hypothetical protein